MEIPQCKPVYFVKILTVQVFLLTENRVESAKKYATYLNLQSTLAISNMQYLEFRAISKFFPGPFSIYSLLPYKISRTPLSQIICYLELIVWSLVYSHYLELFRKYSLQKPILESFFMCVRTGVFNRMLLQLILECFFFLNHSMFE